jgi:hypothetical protein
LWQFARQQGPDHRDGDRERQEYNDGPEQHQSDRGGRWAGPILS